MLYVVGYALCGDGPVGQSIPHGTFGTFGTFDLVVEVGGTVLCGFLYYPGTFGTFGTFYLLVAERGNHALWFSIVPWYFWYFWSFWYF